MRFIFALRTNISKTFFWKYSDIFLSSAKADEENKKTVGLKLIFLAASWSLIWHFHITFFTHSHFRLYSNLLFLIFWRILSKGMAKIFESRCKCFGFQKVNSKIVKWHSEMMYYLVIRFHFKKFFSYGAPFLALYSEHTHIIENKYESVSYFRLYARTIGAKIT